ncbi:uncharacterized protein LOC125238209 [Leguminivora glycinivorella]|uniref:uncharacterized protein LOC125238209 n=1 Tax=Leguminivora glycinivorella TaxID=1035111 RepID=UPI00200C96D1|nr:uncharacterized protein LOC125238209 [Leguminivora glycinivorella]
MLFLKELCCAVMFCVVYDGSAFKLFDAEPLLRGAPKINLTVDEIEDILNIDPGGEYTTLKFQYEHDQYLGQYEKQNVGERCYNDHVRCLTTIMAASRPVCGMDTTGKGERSDFGSMCDLYLANCKIGQAYWTIIDSGNCTRAQKIFIYDFDETKTVKPGRK